MQTVITDWHAFREARQSQDLPSSPALDLAEWTKQLLVDVRNQRELDPEIPLPHVDSNLQHMWEALKGLKRRWRTQKHNKRLTKRIATLAKEVECYANKLMRSEWEELCDRLQGAMSMKRTWFLLRHLLDPSRFKTDQANKITRLTRQLGDGPGWVIRDLINRCMPDGEHEQHPYYFSPCNPSLDEDVTEAEVRGALQDVRTSSAPAQDRVRNMMLRTSTLRRLLTSPHFLTSVG